MKTWFALCFILLVTVTRSTGQENEIFKPTRSGKNIPINTISFTMPASKVTRLHEAKGEKLNLNVPVALVNGDSIKSKHIHVRGTSSSLLRRKSLNISLHKKATFHTVNDTFSLAKFYAVSMNMDKNYIRNKMSYKVLQHLGVRIPASTYANLVINNNTEGLYMIFNPPEQFALTECGATVVIRRPYDAAVEDFEYQGVSRDEANSIKKKFQSVYREIIHKYHGEQLYEKLEEVLDLKGYFTWLAFNHLFNNGDYSDELYLMWNPSKNKFEIIPWDFDDLLHSQPHEGVAKRNTILRDQLIFSSEDALDVAIANDAFVYRKYLETYRQILEKLSPSVLAGILNGVYDEVYPYFLQADILNQSQYDQAGLTDMLHLEEDLRNINQFINMHGTAMRAMIDAQLAR